ncbi:NAD(P)-binding domain-containing protein [Streptomyces sp. NBC_00353]|uniref:NAD(P)-binding domain-containing protein n=1 Tax=Streptomyces sp. NBC_00353 TaxID=2975722 RepID=UPI002E27357F
MQATTHIGVSGLGVIGHNLARNFARHRYTTTCASRRSSRSTRRIVTSVLPVLAAGTYRPCVRACADAGPSCPVLNLR